MSSPPSASSRPQPPAPPPPSGAARRPSPDAGVLPEAFWRWGFPLVVVLLGICIPLLGMVGGRIVLDSTDGNLSRRESDPTAPGYEAVVEPTPTLFVLHVHGGAAVGAAAIALSGDDAGGVIVMSADTVVEREGVRQTIADAFTAGGLDAARQAAELAVGIQLVDAVAVDEELFADLVAPVAPLTVDNNDAVAIDGTELFPAGEVELEAADVGAFLGTRTPGTGEINRIVRYEAFWTAWLQAVAAGGAEAVPGEGEGGIGYAVSELAGGDWTVVQLPATPLPIPGTSDVLFQPDEAEVDEVVARLVPFPVGAPPGSRPRVRLLDGTGELDLGLPVAPAVVAGGGEVAVIGNAEAFDVATTEIQVGEGIDREQAQALRASLGVGEIVESGGDAGSDVTIVLGRDALERYADSPGTVTVAPSSGGTSTDGDGGG